MSIHISCDMYLRLGLHVQIGLYYVLPYKAKISAQHGIGFTLDRCIVYLRLTMPNLQKKRLLIFEIFNIKKCTFFGEPSIELRLAYFFKATGCYLHITIVETFFSGEREIDPVAMAIINPRREMAESGIESAICCSLGRYATDWVTEVRLRIKGHVGFNPFPHDKF